MAFVPAAGARYFLVAAHSGKVLEVKDASKANGAIIQQADPKPYLDSFHQQFGFDVNAERVYVLRARHSGSVIDVAGASKDDGVAVQQFQWHAVDNERFRVIDAGDGTFYLQAVHSGKVLEIYGEEKDAGKPVKQYHNHYSGTNLHQRFRPVLAEDGFAPALLPSFTSPSQMMRDATLGIAGLIPEAGGAIKGVVGLLWPDAGPSMIWNQVMRYIEAYVESKLQEARITQLREAIEGARTNLQEFVDYDMGDEKAAKLTATTTSLNQVDRPFFNTSAPERTLSYLVAIGTIKLTLLQEQARNYAAIAGIPTDTNKAAHEKSLRAGIAEYTRAAQYFREQALNARVAQIGRNFTVRDVTPARHQFTYDIILRDGGDGSEVNIRIGPNGGAETVAGRNAAMDRLYKMREGTVRAQFGAQLDAILAPSLMWRSFDPVQPRPQAKKIRASVGPYGNVHDAVDLSSGKEIAKIEVWADDRVRGMRVTNRSGTSKMVGGEKGQRQVLELATGEFVAGVYGSAYHYLHSLFLETTFGRRLEAGHLHVAYRFQADLPPELFARLADITASSGNNHVDSIQFQWDYTLQGEYPAPSLLAPQLAPLWAPAPASNSDAVATRSTKRKRKTPVKPVVKRAASKKVASKTAPARKVAKKAKAAAKTTAKRTRPTRVRR